MQPKTFRKILDYLFRGRVPLSSIEDAWKVKVVESKTDEDKKEDTKPEEKKDSEEEKKETDDKSEAVELDEKPEEKQSEQDLVLAIQHFIKYITWDYSDAEYYLKEVKGWRSKDG